MSSEEPSGREAADLAGADFIIVAVGLFLVAGIFAAVRPGASRLLDEPAKLTDLLVIAVAMSGVTIPLLIAYMSLGRSADIFSEIGDAVPFFLNRAQIEAVDLAHARLIEMPGDKRFAQKIAAIEEMNNMRSASGIYLTPAHKVSLVPEAMARRYFYYLHDEIDQTSARRHAWLVGAPALVCVFCLVVSHFNTIPALETALFFFSYLSALLALAANLCTYRFLLALARLRGRVQRAAAREVKELCDRLKKLLAAKMSEAQDNAANSGKAARSSAEKLMSLPKPPAS